MKEVTSSAISHIGYDKDSRVLTIVFKHGGAYTFPDVPEDVHESFLNADSIGQHFHQHIRPNFEGTRSKK